MCEDTEKIEEQQETTKNLAKSIKKGRKNAVRIKNAIIKSIDVYPKSSNEIALDINSDVRTVRKYIRVLSDLGVIKMAKFNKELLWIKR